MKQLFIILLFGLFFAQPVLAVQITNLYSADMPVAAQSDDLKAGAIRGGFLKVMIKLTGDPDVDKNPLIRAAIKRADYYVQDYSYSASTPDSSEYWLNIHYDMDDVNRLLKRSGVAYWGDNRPLILAWLAITDKLQTTSIIDNDTENDVLDAMKSQSQKYGVPFIFPVMDVSDLNQVTPNSVTKMDLTQLNAAAKRYSPDGMLVGYIHPTVSGYASEWQLMWNNHKWNWNIEGKTIDEVINAFFYEMNQALVKGAITKAPQQAEAKWLKLEVTNVSARNDLVELMQYLKQLAPVQDVQLSQISGNVIELALLINGTAESFLQQAAIQDRLTLKSQDLAANKLIYEWIR